MPSNARRMERGDSSEPGQRASPASVKSPSIIKRFGSLPAPISPTWISPPSHCLNAGIWCRAGIPASVTPRPVSRKRSAVLPASARINPSPAAEPITLTLSKLIARGQMRRAGIGEALSPARFEVAQLSEMAQRLEGAVGEGGVPAAHFQVHQLRHARQMPRAFIGERLRPAHVEMGDALQPRQLLHGVIRDSDGFQFRNAVFLDDGEDLFPVFASLRAARGEAILLPIDGVKGRPGTQKDRRRARIGGGAG